MEKVLKNLTPSKILTAYTCVSFFLIVLKCIFGIYLTLDNAEYFIIGLGLYFCLFWIGFIPYAIWYCRNIDWRL